MSYLILATRASAEARSRAAYAPLRPADEPEGAVTDAVWSVRDHPADGRAALVIPSTPAEAGLGLSPAAYDGLLTADERAALIGELPADWAIAPAA
ncbi:hypothetical protein ACO2RV_02135 [Ancylobacter sp. VNQ12]|uniref:hypothetical protein n=1 Tax=Ancylobacter sp. VNQ12 TaxID=3400920 RepID=UPI003C0EEC15